MPSRFLIWAFAGAGLLVGLFSICATPGHAAGYAVGGNGLVIKTTDGGQNWSSSSPGVGTLNAVHFYSENVGWAVGNGGALLRTVDGGDSWLSSSPSAVNLNGLFFIDGTRGWIVGDSGKILRTGTAGATWITYSPTIAPLYGIYFSSPTLGWAVGNGVVLRTTNGGINWASAAPTSSTLRDVHFVSATLGWAVGSGGVVLKSTNGGLSWDSSTPTTSDLYAVHFASATLGWAVGEAGAILKTIDGGDTWSIQRPVTTILRSVHFVDDKHGCAVGQNGAAMRTLDGGEHWVVDHPTALNLNGVYFTSFPSGVSVTVGTNPAGLSFSVDGVDYTSPQVFEWEPGSPHTIATTSPQSGGPGRRYEWADWSNDGAISQSVSPQTNTIYTANFTTQYHLTMQSVSGGVTTPPSGWFDADAAVSITATPDPGQGFNGWVGAGAGSYTGWSNPAIVTMDAPITETPSFSANVTVVVKSASTGRSFVVDGATYTAAQTFTWAVGSSHALDAPSPQMTGTGTRHVFSHWSDSGNASHSVSPTSNTTYTVTYETEYLLTMQAAAGGSVTPITGWHGAGTSIEITADADSGYYFQAWSGSGSGSYNGTLNPKTIVLSGPITQQATFGAGTAPAYPTELSLLQSAPNPATVVTDIRFGLPADSDVTIELFDVAGRRVLRDVVENVPRGWQTYRLDVAGGTLPPRSGIYFVRVSGAGASRTSRLVILR